MASRKIFCVVFLLYLCRVESVGMIDRSYEFVINLGKSVAPSVWSFLDCVGDKDVWGCTKEMAGRLLDQWEGEVDKQRRAWQELADSSAALSSGGEGTGARGGTATAYPAPSVLGKEVEQCLTSLADIVQHGVSRALTSRAHHEDESTVNLAISTSGGKKKKKKTKPPKIHLVPIKMEKPKEDDRGFGGKAQTWTIGEKLNDTNARKGRGIVGDLWAAGEKGIDGLAKHVLEDEQKEEEVEDVKDVGETRGKKKKKKKAILKLLILGAILKAKIGTLLQILSFKLQVKFFLIALVGLGINLARFWLDVKKQHQPPQKVIYYEHAQHQHHYDHEEEQPGGWGPWSRSLDPEQIETGDDAEIDFDVNVPYHAHKRNAYSRPLIAQALHART